VKQVLTPEQLPDNSVDTILAMSDKDVLIIARPLLQLLVEVSDSIGSGHKTWFSWGATKEGTAFTATLYQFAGALTIYEQSPLTLLQRLSELL
jgi:hypothetical protein